MLERVIVLDECRWFPGPDRELTVWVTSGTATGDDINTIWEGVESHCVALISCNDGVVRYLADDREFTLVRIAHYNISIRSCV